MKTSTLTRRTLGPLFGASILFLATFLFIRWWVQEQRLLELREGTRSAIERHIAAELASSETAAADAHSASSPAFSWDVLSLPRLAAAIVDLHRVLGVHLVVLLEKPSVDPAAWGSMARQAAPNERWDAFADRVLPFRTLTALPPELASYAARPAGAVPDVRFELSLDGRTLHGSAMPLRDAAGRAAGEVVFLQDRAATLAGARRTARLAAGVGLAVAVLAWLLIYRLVRARFVAPLLELRAVAERAGRREFSRSASIQRRDELGDLARSIDRMVQELRDAQDERTRLIVDAALDAVISIDEQGRIIDWNAQAETIFGWPRAEALGHLVSDLIIPEEHRQRHQNGMERFLRTGESTMLNRRVEVTALRRSGEVFPAEIAITPLRSGDQLSFSAFVRDITDRKQGHEALRKSEERFRRLVETASVIPWEADPERYRFTYVGPQAVKLLGYTLEEWHQPEFWSNHLHPEDRAFAHDFLVSAADNRREDAFEYRVLAEDGRIVWLRDIVTFARDESGTDTMLGFRFDITERKRLERQLLGSQRMEAVGRLAGGVAHDFNNLITAILGYASLVQASLPTEDPAQEDVAEIARAANRAASLTQQLLAFARKQVIQPRLLDLNELVLNLEKMLKRLIGEDIWLTTRTAADLWQVKLDPGQFEQVLVNLAVNARDAMPEGGKLIIETANARLKASVIQRAEVVPGDYVMIAVTDTGTGMDQATVARIFEPFFTTKEVGKGTGLGLATCYGIVKQAGGYIFVYTEVERGTTFKIYIPRAQEVPVVAERLPAAAPRRSGGETVLLVEDDQHVRDFAERALRSRGYHVLAARYGDEAIALARGYAGEIQLLLTDVFMPHLGGGETAHAIREERPGIKVLYMSAYADAGLEIEADLGEDTAFLSKPFTPDELDRRVRELLDDALPVLAAD